MSQDVVVGEEDFDEGEEEEEDEVVAEGNRPAEIVKRALEVGSWRRMKRWGVGSRTLVWQKILHTVFMVLLLFV